MKNIKNPKVMITIIIAVLVMGGAIALVMKDNNDKNNNETNTSETGDAMEKETDIMEKDEAESVDGHDDAMEGEDAMEKDGDAMEKDESSSMEKKETFVTLADYESAKSDYTDNTKVYFFHASWCSICKGIESEIEADPSRIPSGTTLIKTDYDSELSLRQKYGVTTQYTFVQVDNSGNQIAKWSATSLDKALAGIQS